MLPVLKHLPGMLMAVSFSFFHVVRVNGRTFSDWFGWWRSLLLRQVTKSINQSTLQALFCWHWHQLIFLDHDYLRPYQTHNFYSTHPELPRSTIDCKHFKTSLMMRTTMVKILMIPGIAIISLMTQNILITCTDAIAQISNMSSVFDHMTKKFQATHHDKTFKGQCIAREPKAFKTHFFAGKFTPLFQGATPIMVATPCMTPDSIGNRLGDYFEGLMCSMTVGLHYMSLNKVFVHNSYLVPPFLAKLPDYYENPTPATHDFQEVRKEIHSKCKCNVHCHDNKHALWLSGLDIIRPILRRVGEQQLSYIQKSEPTTVVHQYDLCKEDFGAVLPLIPDVAIHYRCGGDNFQGKYGFLRFVAFAKLIPKTAKTIYVLAEDRDKYHNHRRLIETCDYIFHSMHDYLQNHFPNSTVLIRRGDDPFTDAVRLMYAETTICSVSSFCLWPAIARGGAWNGTTTTTTSSIAHSSLGNNGGGGGRSSRSSIRSISGSSSISGHSNGNLAAPSLPDRDVQPTYTTRQTFFPLSPHFLDGDKNIDFGFKWIIHPSVVDGWKHNTTSVPKWLEMLNDDKDGVATY